MAKPSVHGSKRQPSLAGWIAIVGSGVLLGLFIWYAFWGYNLSDATVAEVGVGSLVLGIALSAVLGGGLMALLFWSNRKGYDR
jgi:hypothetical protein